MQAKIRDGRLDAIKWIAMITMVIDHVRFIYNDMTWLYAIGRVSFPFFCLAIAINVYRNLHSQQVYFIYGKYILWMMTFSIISEIPYRLYFHQSHSLNVMPTLTLGLLIAITIYHYKDNTCRVVLALYLGIALIFKGSLMYGVFGVLLPTAFLLSLIKPLLLWPLPMIVSILSNYSVERILGQISGAEAYNTSAFIISFITPLVGFLFTHANAQIHVPPVGKWGYFFYPVHILLLYIVRFFV